MENLEPRVLRKNSHTTPQKTKKELPPSWQNYIPYILPITLFIAVMLIYANTFSADLLTSWDDNVYITQNEMVRDFGPGKLIEMFTNFYNGEYIPVTLLELAIEHLIWGSNSTGYHLTNVVLHALNTILVYTLMQRLQGRTFIAFLTAALFAIHPIQVETVAWVSQHKNLLSLLFFLLSFLMHTRTQQNSTNNWLLPIAWGLFLLSLLTKPAAMFAPILFLTYDYFQNIRIDRLLVRNLPYIIIGTAAAFIAYLADRSQGGIANSPGSNVFENIQLIGTLIWDYTKTIVVPLNLNNLYIYDLTNLSIISMTLGIAISIALVIFTILQPLGKAMSTFTSTWIIVFMLPVINIIPLTVLRADRYTYFAIIGIAMIAGNFAEWLWHKLQQSEFRYALASILGIILTILIVLTISRNRVWNNSISLWQDHLEDYTTSYTGMLNLGAHYYTTGELENAKLTFQQLIREYPEDAHAIRLLGNTAALQGDYETAFRAYQRVQQLNPSPDLVDDMGAVLLQAGVEASNQGNNELALAFFLDALNFIPNEAILHNNIGNTLHTLGQPRQAIAALQRAIELDPDYTRAWVNLGDAALIAENFQLTADAYAKALETGANLNAQQNSNYCLALGEIGQDPELALQTCTRAIELAPNNGLYLGRAAHVLLLFNLPEEALIVAERAVQVVPDMSLAQRAYGDALALNGRTEEAIAAYQQALAIDPQNVRAQQGLDALLEGSQ